VVQRAAHESASLADGEGLGDEVFVHGHDAVVAQGRAIAEDDVEESCRQIRLHA